MDLDRDTFKWKVFAVHSGIIIGALSVVCTLFPSIFIGGDSDIATRLDQIDNRLDLIDFKLNTFQSGQETMTTQMLLLQNDITTCRMKIAAGNLNDTNLLNMTTENFNISIEPSLNNSTLGGRFMIYGVTDLDYRLIEDGIYKIYLVSKLGNKYFVQTEGYPDDSQKWRGYRPCLIPSNYNNTTIYAIITKEDLLKAEYRTKMPAYVSISEPIYINIRP